MGTVTSTNAGIANLMETLTSIGSPLVSSSLATPALQTALQNASPGDIVKLSQAAIELQQTDAIFGVSDTSNMGLSASAAQPAGPPASKTPSSTADQLTDAQAEMQARRTAALFGTNTASPSSDTLFNLIG